MTNVFLTILHTKNFTPISIGLVSETGETFYGIFKDHDENDWTINHVLKNLYSETPNLEGDFEGIKLGIIGFLQKFDNVRVWVDLGATDWHIFYNNIFSKELPSNTLYFYCDLCTLLYVKGFYVNLARDAFSGIKGTFNALTCSKQSCAIYKKINDYANLTTRRN